MTALQVYTTPHFLTNLLVMMFDNTKKRYIAKQQTVRQLSIKCNGGGYVMPVDADDLISNRLAEFFAGRNDGLCYKSRYGYIYHRGSSFVTKHRDLYRTCGSCSVLYLKDNEFPTKPFEEKEEAFFLCAHRMLPQKAIANGKKFGTIPFPSTVYVLGTGENHSIISGNGINWKRRVEGLFMLPRYLNQRIRKEFNLL